MILSLGFVLTIVNPKFLLPETLINVLAQASYAAIGGAGMTLAIASGGFDLSVGSILSISACVVATLLPGYGIFIAITSALIVGIIFGIINGTIITKLNISPFIVTLAMMNIIKGITFIYTQNRQPIIIQDKMFNVLGGYLGPVPVPVILMIIVYTILYLVLEHSRFGRHLCAVGSNEEAASVTGLNVDKIKIMVFSLTGLTAAIVGLLRASQLMVVDATTGEGYELTAITVAIVGGTSLSGGKGNLLGSLLAAIFVTMIHYGLNLLNVDVYIKYLVLGGLLIFALYMNGFGERRLKAKTD